ncbi:tyrosine-protein kinase Wzc [Serratia fonticola]|uniref:tyrosine-protein kinase Wzc n=1 Tax=Serratia fonticola TaxID=47917 RepID=UPI00192B85E4|nr:tyrosine-protein kinase Wzc [Serratia fonticola]MBL5859062.1 tyrosine-protein kinase Wzc [Serratia fonticola]CAI1892806.1 Tyrosine-protein kinase wzc [Serratia fonticola]
MTNKIQMANVETNEDIDIGRYIGALIDSKWLILGVVCTFLFFSILYSILATPIYRAEALIQVEQNVGNSILNDISQMLPSNQPASAAEIELIKSRMVIGKTIDELKLDTVVDEKFFPIIGKRLAKLFDEDKSTALVTLFEVPTENLESPYQLKFIGNGQFVITDPNGMDTTGQIGKLVDENNLKILVSDISADEGAVFKITKYSKLAVFNKILDNFNVADKGKDTGILALTLDGDDPDKTREILESISNNYLMQNVDRKSEEAEKSLIFLNEQLPKIRDNLNQSESKLNQYRQENDSVDLTLEAKSVLDTMVSVESQLNESTFKEAEISKLYTKEHPSYKALLEKRKTLEDEKKKLDKRVSGMPKTQQEILRLTRDVQSGQEVYMQLLNKQQELNISKASTVGNVRIIDGAITQPKPVKPNKILVVLIMTMVGGVLSVAYVIIKTAMHRGIESASQLEERGINVYSSIPISLWQKKKDNTLAILNKGKKKNARSHDLLAYGNPSDLAIEALRSLRTSLHFAMLESKNNILMITGATPAIGKTFVSANLAAVISQSQQKVLIIDADMRKGYLHELFDVNTNTGLSDVLSGRVDYTSAIKQTFYSGVDILTRGQVPPNPSELLMNARLSELMISVSKDYDLVIVDTPPILAVTDAVLVGHHVGTSLMVAKFEGTTLKEIEMSFKRFEQNGVDIKGIILNAVIKRAASYYGYGNYEYVDYKYESDETKK